MNRTVKGTVALALSISLLSGGTYVHSQFKGATETINRLEQKVDNQNIKITKQNTQINTSIEKINELTENKKALEIDNNELKKSIDSLHKSNKDLQEKNAKLKRELAEKPQQVSQLPSRGSFSSTDVKATYNISATAYTAFCDTGCTGVTATGKDVSNTIHHNGLRIIAVDPSVIPLYSIVVVQFPDGTSFKAIALDTGGAIQGRKIDVLVDNVDKAWNFGVQDVIVKVIKWG